MAKYEWVDETGIHRPSLVFLDITDYWPDDWQIPVEEIIENAPVIKSVQIESLESLKLGKGGRVRVRMPQGYLPYEWHKFTMNQDYYACFLAFRRKETLTQLAIRQPANPLPDKIHILLHIMQEQNYMPETFLLSGSEGDTLELPGDAFRYHDWLNTMSCAWANRGGVSPSTPSGYRWRPESITVTVPVAVAEEFYNRVPRAEGQAKALVIDTWLECQVQRMANGCRDAETRAATKLLGGTNGVIALAEKMARERENADFD